MTIQLIDWERINFELNRALVNIMKSLEEKDSVLTGTIVDKFLDNMGDD